MIYSPITVKKVWEDILSSQCVYPFRVKEKMMIIIKYPIVLLLTDSHGEQWFWEDTMLRKRFGNIYKLFTLIPKVNCIITSLIL